MKRPDPPSDRDIQEAFRALDGTIPDGHLDGFSSRVLARLDEPEVSGMNSRELAEGSGVSRPDEVALGAAAATNEANVTPAREENSGLHEIKALASTTKRRISQRVTSEAEAEESLLVGAASGSFRAAAALPDPAREAAAEPASARIGRPVLARPASEVDRRPPPSRSSSAPFWVLGGVATAAAAAAVAVFVFGVGREKKQDQEVATATSSGDQLAQAGGASDRAAAAGSPAPADMKFAEPPPAAPGAAPAASGAPATIALADPEEAKQEEQDGSAEGGVRRAASTVGRGDGKADDKSAPAPAKKKVIKETEKETRSPAPTGKGAPGGGGKDLNDVLDEVTGGVKAPVQSSPDQTPKKPTKKALDRRDVSTAMGAVRSQVMRCRDKEQFEGTITVKFHVAPSGQVTSAEATGSKAGSPTGACVAAAVKKAVFPPFDGAPTSFTYPFLLAE